MRKITILLFLTLLVLSLAVYGQNSNSTNTDEWKMFGRTLDNTDIIQEQ